MVGNDLHALVAGQAVVRLVGGGKRLRLEPSPEPSEDPTGRAGST